MAIAVALSCSSPAAADIVQPLGFAGNAMNTYFGQSFTATANESVVGVLSFQWDAMNLSDSDPEMKAELYSGFGVGGTLLGVTDAVTVPDSVATGEWVDLSFAVGVPLTANSTYSIIFSYTGAGSRSGGFRYVNLIGDDFSSVYIGGHRLTGGGATATDPPVVSDLAFRVLSVVPEAHAWALGGAVTMAGGAASLGGRFRRRGRASPVPRR